MKGLATAVRELIDERARLLSEVALWRGRYEGACEQAARNEASLRADIQRVEGEAHLVRHYRERETYFARVLNVTDGGQFRADWDSAIRHVLGARDTAQAAYNEAQASLQTVRERLAAALLVAAKAEAQGKALLAATTALTEIRAIVVELRQAAPPCRECKGRGARLPSCYCGAPSCFICHGSEEDYKPCPDCAPWRAAVARAEAALQAAGAGHAG